MMAKESEATDIILAVLFIVIGVFFLGLTFDKIDSLRHSFYLFQLHVTGVRLKGGD